MLCTEEGQYVTFSLHTGERKADEGLKMVGQIRIQQGTRDKQTSGISGQTRQGKAYARGSRADGGRSRPEREGSGFRTQRVLGNQMGEGYVHPVAPF